MPKPFTSDERLTVVRRGLEARCRKLALKEQEAKEEEAQGTGLGLPILSRIVQIYGGTIRVESAPGKESTITLCLPLEVD